MQQESTYPPNSQQAHVQRLDIAQGRLGDLCRYGNGRSHQWWFLF